MIKYNVPLGAVYLQKKYEIEVLLPFQACCKAYLRSKRNFALLNNISNL